MEARNLEKVNLSHVVLHALLIPCNRPDELAKRIEPGVRDAVRIVTTMLSHGVDDDVVKISDAIEMTGGNVRNMRKHISNAIRISCEEYDGNFGRPPMIPVDQFIYIVTVLAIKDLGRFTDSLDEFTAMTQLIEFIDISAINDEYDMRCFIFLIDYFTKCLQENEKVSLSREIKNYNSRFVTKRRLKNFFRKNNWYEDFDGFKTLFGVTLSEAPTLTQITNPLFKVLKDAREVEKEMSETYSFSDQIDEDDEEEN